MDYKDGCGVTKESWILVDMSRPSLVDEVYHQPVMLMLEVLLASWVCPRAWLRYLFNVNK